MKLSEKIIALLLALLMIALPLAACNKNEEPPIDDPNTEDEFEGSISNGNGTTTEPTPQTPPIAEGKDEDVVYIATAEDIKKIAQKGTYILTADIDMSDVEFAPIGTYLYPFMGTLKSADGESFKIKNLKASVTEADMGPTITYKYAFAGFFGVTKNATVSGITIENAEISASHAEASSFVSGGILAGYMIGTKVENCNFDGKVTTKSTLFNAYSGGVCGILEGGEIKNTVVNSVLSVELSKNRAVSGGIAAYAISAPTVSHCTAKGSISATTEYGVSYAGGIVGNTRKASYTACRAENSVCAETTSFASEQPAIGTAYAGGIVAVSSALNEDDLVEFTRCYSVSATVNAKGNLCSAYSGGIAGYVEFSHFRHCYSISDVILSASSTSRVSYAAAGFAKIVSDADDPSDKNPVDDLKITGCLALGNVNVTHSDALHLVFIGTFHGLLSDKDSSKYITRAYYNGSSQFLMNGAVPETLSKNGNPAPAFTYDNLEIFGWSKSEWSDVGGIITAL